MNLCAGQPIWLVVWLGKEGKEKRRKYPSNLVEDQYLSGYTCQWGSPRNWPKCVQNKVAIIPSLLTARSSDTLHTVGSYADLQEQGTSSPPSSPTADNDTAQDVPGLPPDLKYSLLVFVVFVFSVLVYYLHLTVSFVILGFAFLCHLKHGNFFIPSYVVFLCVFFILGF